MSLVPPRLIESTSTLSDTFNVVFQTECTDMLKTIQRQDEVFKSAWTEKRKLQDHLNAYESEKKKHNEETSQSCSTLKVAAKYLMNII